MIGSKKNLSFSAQVKRTMVEPDNLEISVVRQCQLLGINRSTIYYRGRVESNKDAELTRLLDAQYTLTPFYGYRRMTVCLQNSGYKINHKRVLRLMRKLGLEAIYPKPNLSKPNKEHLKFPYLLREVKIEHSNQVWATDITYIRLKGGFIYLLAIMDWHSRFVIDFEISNSLESTVFVETRETSFGKREAGNLQFRSRKPIYGNRMRDEF